MFRAAPPRFRYALGFTGLLVWLALVYVAGELAFHREMGMLSQQAQRELEVQALSLRGIAQRYKHIPYTGANRDDVTSLLKSPNDKSLEHRVDLYLEDVNRRIGSEALYLMDIKGNCIAASNWNLDKTFKNEPYHYRKYFREAAAGGFGVDYAVGTTTKKPGLFYANPVQSGKEVIGVMAIKVTLTDIEKSWSMATNPVFLLDRKGVVILSTVAPFLYSATRALTNEELLELRTTHQYDVEQFVPTPWRQESSAAGGYQLLHITQGSKMGSYLVKQDYLPEFDWTLMVTENLSSAWQARWIAITIAVLASAVVLFGTLFWWQGRRRRAYERKLRMDLENDVRERTKDLRNAEAFRKAMGDSLLVGMRARNLEGRIIFVNPALCDITGYAADELMGRLPPYPYWYPDDLERHWAENDAVLSGRIGLTGFESRIRHRDGHDVYTMVYTAPLIDASGVHTGWMSSVVDITAQKAAEEQARAQATKMQRTGRLASMGEMASTLAHELGQPLMALVNYAGAARIYGDKGHKELLVETLSEISAQAQRAAEIVARIRGFVRQQTPGFAPCAVNDLIHNVLALVRPEVRHQNAKVILRLDTDLPAVRADKVLLEQVILNLVLNAVQAMHENFPSDKIVWIDTGTQGGMVFIRVSDKGPGISAEVAAQLFQPFFTTKPEGLGLGLNICRSTIETHRGRLEFENRQGGGAVFTIYLPESV